MYNRAYSWKRFWCPPTGKWHPDKNGFLTDPEHEFSQYIQPDVVSFERISDTPCLILLGEPGIGKTTAMHSEYESISIGVKSKGDMADWHDLGSFSSEEMLVKRVFESPEFSGWKQGNYHLHLFLDSLDESRLEIHAIDRALMRELPNCPLDRLTLRLACRTAEWPFSLESGLKETFGEENVGIYELLPLRRTDVETTARTRGINSEQFIDLLLQKDIVPLSIKPITLDFLLKIYRGDAKASYSAMELYRRGCHLLCEESNKHRRTAKHWGKLTADQRLAIAARIAAVTVMCNKHAVWTDIDRGDNQGEDLTIRELCVGTEKADSGEILVTEVSVRETLETGLFSSRGPNRMGWAHQTYAEFLAAMWLGRWRVPLTRIKRVMLSEGDPEQKLVPQLHGVAAWLGSMHNGWRKHLIENQPEVMLLSDLSAIGQREKAALVEKLLIQKSEEGVSIYRDYYRRHFGKLGYPSSADQLRPFIIDALKPDVLRITAIEIAMSCKLIEFSDALADIAVDGSQSAYVRQLAVFTVARIGDEQSRFRLKSLIWSSADEDPDDELKGCALRALWPNLITIEEVLSALKPPRKDNFLGAYRMFCEYEFERGLKVEHLPKALDWVSKTAFGSTLRKDVLNVVCEAIIMKAIKHIKSPEVFVVFGKAALTWLKPRHRLISHDRENELKELFSIDKDLQRTVTEAIVTAIDDPEKEFTYLIFYQPPLIQSKDIPWMIDRYEQATSDKIRTVWAKLIWNAHNWNEPQYFDAILTACWKEKNGILFEVFTREIEPVELGSSLAKKMRADFERFNREEQEADNQPMLDPTPEQRVANCLEQFEAGDLSAWIRLTREITLESDSTHYLNDTEPLLTETPGWRDATKVTRAKVIKAAEKYVTEGNPETDKWLGSDETYYSALAGYKALLLLKHEAKESYDGLPNDVWQKWAAIIVCFPFDFDPELIAKAYYNTPSQIIDIVQRKIDEENAKHGAVFIVNRIVHCWDGRIADALLSAAKNPRLRISSLESILNYLLKHDAGMSYAEELVNNRRSEKEDARAKAMIAAKALLIHAKDAGWSIWWPIAEEDPEFINEVLLEAVSHTDLRENLFLSRFDEEQLGDLYIFLAQNYRPDTDPVLEGIFTITPELKIRRFRDRILEHLKARGTAKACTAIEDIAEKFPEFNWLKQVLSAAEETARGGTWKPMQPAELLALAQEFKPINGLTEEPLSPRFRRSGDYWEVWFEGEEKTIKDMVGMSYIAYMLDRPDEGIKASSLYLAVTGLPPTEPKDPHKGMTAEQLEEQGLSGIGLEDVNSMVDPQTVTECNKKIHELEFNITQASESGNALKEQALKKELKTTREYLASATDIRGRPRQTQDADKRIYQAVSKAISRAINELTEKHEALGRHLRNSISLGSFISYKPERPISWQL